MPIDHAAILLQKHPTATIVKEDRPNDSIFFTDDGRDWVAIFHDDTIIGVWDVTPTSWDERAQDQQESIGF